MKLGDRLKLLRKEKDMKQKELANKLNVSTSTVGMWEQNRTTPDFETLIELTNIFNVSSDYLLGLTDKIQPHHGLTWHDVQEHFPSAIILTEEETDLIEYYKDLSKIDRRWIMGQLADLIKRSKSTSNNSADSAGFA